MIRGVIGLSGVQKLAIRLLNGIQIDRAEEFRPWILAYNSTLEAVWEGEDLTEAPRGISRRQSVQAMRFSTASLHGYRCWCTRWFFPEWHDRETIRNLFVGPNVSYRRENWFLSTVAAPGPGDLITADEADFQLAHDLRYSGF